jgi:rare lipoprotein A
MGGAWFERPADGQIRRSPQCRADAPPTSARGATSVMVRAMPATRPLFAVRRPIVRATGLGFVLLAALLLAACGSAPKGPAGGRDGPPLQSTLPADVSSIPDAQPRIEPLRVGGPNKPYEVLGQNYRPETRDVPIREKGLASWYGRKFDGRRTASGEIYDMNAMTAAHKTMPLPSYARVRNPKNGREIVVRINDRGPFVAGRIIDLSYAAAMKLGVAGGVSPVEVERITFEDIRTGAWQRGGRGAPPQPPGVETPPTAVAAAPGTAEARTQPAAGIRSPDMTSVPAVAVATVPAPMAPDDRPDERPPAVAASTPAPDAPVASVVPRGFWVQLGAFRERDGVESFRQHLASEIDWLAPVLAVFRDASLYRLQAGPYASREDAQGAAQRVREALQLVPVIVERR